MLCNAIDAPHKSVRQNFNLSFKFTWDLCNVFEKSSCFFFKDIFDQWILQLVSNLGKQKVMSLILNLLDSF